MTSLELALVLVPFMFMMMAVFDLGRYFFTVQAMTTLMMNAARYTMIAQGAAQLGSSTISDWSGVTNVTVPALLDPTQGSICITFFNTQGGLGVSTVQVTVTYPFTANTPGLSGLANTLPDPGTEQGICSGALATNGMLTETSTYSY